MTCPTTPQTIRMMLAAWSAKPLIDRTKPKPHSCDMYEPLFQTSIAERSSEIMADGRSITKLLKDVNKRIKVCKMSVCACAGAVDALAHSAVGWCACVCLCVCVCVWRQVSQGQAEWKNFVDFVSGLVLRGLLKVVVSSCAYLNTQMVRRCRRCVPLSACLLDVHQRGCCVCGGAGPSVSRT
jgi:hypothetical protein